MTRKNRSLLKEEMRYHITSWQQSEQSQKEYCLANNLQLYKFHYWIHKFRTPDLILKNEIVAGGHVQIKMSHICTKREYAISIAYIS